jgi:hypothetical protein
MSLVDQRVDPLSSTLFQLILGQCRNINDDAHEEQHDKIVKGNEKTNIAKNQFAYLIENEPRLTSLLTSTRFDKHISE